MIKVTRYLHAIVVKLHASTLTWDSRRGYKAAKKADGVALRAGAIARAASDDKVWADYRADKAHDAAWLRLNTNNAEARNIGAEA